MTNQHALIIDDQQFNLDVLEVMLKKEGIGSTTVGSLRRLSSTLDQLDQVNVVFLDLEFPDGDGLKLLAQLKVHPRLQAIPIVAYTVHTAKLEAARHAGFHSFIGKPLDGKRFPRQLKQILSNHPVWEE